MVLLVQKEVAERIVARDGKESLLSVSVKAYGEPRVAGTVKAGSFNPPPRVDSAILVIEHISRDFFADIDEARFFDVLHAGFAQKRKKLIPKLKRAVSIGDDAFTACDVSPEARAEELSAAQWRCIAERVG